MAHLPRIPDILTTANLASGVASILFASQGQLTIACWLVFAGAFFDVLDGLAARAYGGGSELGKQLDSLADMVTFGTAPAMCIWFAYAHYVDAEIGWALPVAVILIPTASAWRLAKFNIDTRQSTGFLGLPTPSNGLFWVSCVLVVTGSGMLNGPGSAELSHLIGSLALNPYFTLGLAFTLGALMLSEIPLPGLKFTQFSWHGNEVIYVIAILSVFLVVLYGILAVPLILLIYLLSPIWGRLFVRQRS